MLKFPAIKNIVIKAEFAGEGTFFREQIFFPENFC